MLLTPFCKVLLSPRLGGAAPLLCFLRGEGVRLCESCVHMLAQQEIHTAKHQVPGQLCTRTRACQQGVCDGAKPARSHSQPAWSLQQCSGASLCICITVLFLMTVQLVFLHVSCERLSSLEHAVNTCFSLHHSLSGSRLYLLHSIKSLSQRQKWHSPLWPFRWAFLVTKL